MTQTIDHAFKISSKKGVAFNNTIETNLITNPHRGKVTFNYKNRPIGSNSGKNSFDSKNNHDKHSYINTEDHSKLIGIIKSIIDSQDLPPKKSVFKFDNTPEAALFNSKILAAYDFDYEKVLSKQKNTTIDYGSEFRHPSVLNKLLKFHKNNKRIESFLSHGTDTSLSPLDEETLKADCSANIERGNHTSSSKSKEDIEFVTETYKKEVEKGWMIPFTKESIAKMKNACVIPIGTVHQTTIDEKGNPKEKRRLTHDCSWEGPSSHSINNRINEELLEPLQYGRCIFRVLHNIQHMRFNNPTKRILMTKHDLDSAYRRLHWHAKCALLCITIVNSIAYLLTRLCFGIASGPSEWCLISETIVDFASILIADSSWNPKKIFNPKKEISSEIEYLDDSIPLKTTKEILFKVPTTDSYIDGYIDDMITIIIALNHLIYKAIQVIPLLCLVFFRPVHDNEPLERTDILSTKKLIAEGKLSEVKTFLGWTINTRSMRVYLPSLKALNWIKEIDDSLHSKKLGFKKLEKLIGKLNHAAFIIPFSRYFLNRIRYQMHLAKKFGPQKLSGGSREDLVLFKDLLAIMSTNGASIANITFSLPDYFCWSDACSYGMGGYNSAGQAWQWKLPSQYINKVSINLLEFVASVVTIILTLQGREKDSRIFAFTDNSSALGWLHKASFHPATQHKHDFVARELARFMVKNEFSIFSEHIKGEQNSVADTLSREFSLTKSELTSHITRLFPQQVSQNFTIIDIPQDLISWISSILDDSTTNAVSVSKHPKKKKHTLRNRPIFVQEQTLKTNSYQSSTIKKKSKSSAPSPLQSEETFLVKLKRKHCSPDQLKTHYDMFVRCSGLTDSAIRELTSQEIQL